MPKRKLLLSDFAAEGEPNVQAAALATGPTIAGVAPQRCHNADDNENLDPKATGITSSYQECGSVYCNAQCQMTGNEERAKTIPAGMSRTPSGTKNLNAEANTQSMAMEPGPDSHMQQSTSANKVGKVNPYSAGRRCLDAKMLLPMACNTHYHSRPNQEQS